MRNKFLASVLAGLAMFGASCLPAEATQLDAYRNMLAKQAFTLKYAIAPATLLEQEHNRSGLGEWTNKDYRWGKRPHQGLIVVDGATRYTDQFDGGTAFIDLSGSSLSGTSTTEELAKKKTQTGSIRHTCMLIKNGEVFSWYRIDDENGKPDYEGRYDGGYLRSQVVAGEHFTAVNPIDAMMQEMDYGDPRIAKMLAIIYPPDSAQTFLDTPDYGFVDAGTLASGLSYEDYSASEDGRYYAARFYFNQGRLVKFASVSFPESLDVAKDRIERSLIVIEDFSPAPVSQYLSLPAGLKDVTKRGEK